MTPSREPVLRPLEQMVRRVGEIIGSVVEDYNENHPHSPRIGFTLMMFTFGKADDPDQWMTYISNADRESMCAAMEEFLDKQVQEGMDREPG